MVFVSDGPREGLHILCKDKGVSEVGVGAFNRATLMLHIDLKKEEVARSGKRDHVTNREIEANDAFSKIDPKGESFVTGTVVHYAGTWSSRDLRNVNFPKNERLKLHNVEKTLIIMDNIPGGDLFNVIKMEPKQRIKAQTQKENIKICLDIARGLSKSHSAGFVNLDSKPENIFIGSASSDGSKSDPKIGDFGYVFNVGAILHNPVGSPGYVSPEVLLVCAGARDCIDVRPANEIWIFGCIMALMTKGDDFYHYTQQCAEPSNLLHIINEGEVQYETTLKTLFPQHSTLGTLDSVIFGSLRYDPEKRLTVGKIVEALEALYQEVPDKAHPSDPNWLSECYAYA